MIVSNKNRPFLKYAGGKYKLIDTIKLQLTPSNRLIEPFVGGGSVFLNTEYKNYVCNDSNADLIELYNIIKLDGVNFIDYAHNLFTPVNNTEQRYYELRNDYNITTDVIYKSALFVYLNKHGFSGLYRTNRSGGFNVPYGRYKSVTFPEKELFNFYGNCGNVEFNCSDFLDTMDIAVTGDCVYCDPPYSPLDQISNFTSYIKDSFGVNEHIKLRDKSIEISNKGITVVISNHSTDYTTELYSTADNIVEFPVKRNNAAKAEHRKVINELLVTYKSK